MAETVVTVPVVDSFKVYLDLFMQHSR